MGTDDLDPGLRDTLREIGRVASTFHDDWWIIGSAAIALLGHTTTVADVDLLVSDGDARALFASRWATGMDHAKGGAQFRSTYGRHTTTPLVVEVMGGLELLEAGRWYRIEPRSRIAVSIGNDPVFIPDATEQLEMLRRFGRPKDLKRALLLDPGIS